MSKFVQSALDRLSVGVPGCAAVDQDSLEFARRLAEMLPDGLPEPEVGVDPDGSVSFDWEGLSISLGPDGELRYAGIVGGVEDYGEMPWGDGIAEVVVRLMSRDEGGGK